MFLPCMLDNTYISASSGVMGSHMGKELSLGDNSLTKELSAWSEDERQHAWKMFRISKYLLGY